MATVSRSAGRPASRIATRGRRRSAAALEATATRQAVLYARVSTKDQEREREGCSIPAQNETLGTYARTHHYDIVYEFIEKSCRSRPKRNNPLRQFPNQKAPPTEIEGARWDVLWAEGPSARSQRENAARRDRVFNGGGYWTTFELSVSKQPG
jgi:hypothetical protein